MQKENSNLQNILNNKKVLFFREFLNVSIVIFYIFIFLSMRQKFWFNKIYFITVLFVEIFREMQNETVKMT